MGRIRAEGTSPELRVRKAAHRLGFRFRLHRADLPGKPDLVFPSLRKAIFVHGCFWHGHDCARGARIPETNREYWLEKVRRNVERDRESVAELARKGWQVLVVWECQTHDNGALCATLQAFLSDR